MRFELTLTMEAAARSPRPRNGSVVIPTAGYLPAGRQVGCAGSRTGSSFHVEANQMLASKGAP
ncbi:MAG: hypothetical protein HY695_18095 [Deltaproteobacteria bacterium]|nr:hypothetical protein [Deltaproteobacteria bacterium]